MAKKQTAQHDDDDSFRDRAIYYAGCAAVIAACLKWGHLLSLEQFSDELPDYLEPWKMWHDQFVLKKFRFMGWLTALAACRKFRKGYHSRTTPLHSLVWGYISFTAGIIAADLFLGQPVSVFQKTDNIFRYVVVWALMNLDPTDALWTCTNNEYVQWVLGLINTSKGAGGFAKLGGMIDKCDGNIFCGLFSLCLLMTLGDVIHALEYKLVTGKNEPTVYSEGGLGWGFIYKVVSIVVYFLACYLPETSDEILGMHEDLTKESVFLIIVWVNIWSKLAHKVLSCPASHMPPNELFTGLNDTLFTKFPQPEPVVKNLAHVDTHSADTHIEHN